ncbi:RNase adapter RapZ [Phaeovulum sp.]|uniref:RNase adapter RapZ n=1 Tax=Phaeovulum sp. TaxID=2934796 RepID=UPI00272FF168|nr:RNase adapter RapZ [Phaeovulum sp.]MDP1669359.1 RNase adapter RapZ [Phaeovulum sp.]MDZ4119635.1 RNase adapter RapZ [Phaeovulum sp.]
MTQARGTTGGQSEATQRVVLVTGASGAGRSTSIAALEDLGYEVIDNLPLSLVPRLLVGPPMGRPVALGIDVRNRDFAASRLIELIDRLTREPTLDLEVLFLDCQSDELVRRYRETRRRHPLSPGTDPAQGVAMELDLLAPIRVRADVLIDTTGMSPHELKAEIARWFALGDAPGLLVSLNSFSYKRGLPRGLDMMFDCRFLANPHWVPELRTLDGRAPKVAAHVAADPLYAEFCKRVCELLLFVLPAHLNEGKSHLAIGFGCTGGQHRSVVVTEHMAKALSEAGWAVSKRHRELERKAAAEQPGSGA